MSSSQEQEQQQKVVEPMSQSQIQQERRNSNSTSTSAPAASPASEAAYNSSMTSPPSLGHSSNLISSPSGRRHLRPQSGEQKKPTGRMTRVNNDIHPNVVPSEHRDDRVSAAVDKFEAKQSVAEQMKARDEARPSDAKVRGKGKPVAPDQFGGVSPKWNRDTKITEERAKFEARDGIAQLMGEKDRVAVVKPTGKTRGVKDVDQAPESVKSGVNSRNEKMSAEREKFASSQHGVMDRIGTQDHPLLSRKRVIAPTSALATATAKVEATNAAAAAAGSNDPSSSSSSSAAATSTAKPTSTSTVTTAELLNPKPSIRTIVRRTTHTNKVLNTYELAISARTAKRQEAQEALTNACDFLSTFSESDTKPHHPSVRQVDLKVDTYGTVPCAQVLGFPGMGAHSRQRVRGCKHFDPQKSSLSETKASPKMDASLKESAAVAQQLHHQKFDRTLDSHHVKDSLKHPDHREFVTKLKKPTIVTKPRRAMFCCPEAPDWWMTSARQTSTNPWAHTQAQAERPTGRKHCSQTQADHITVRANNAASSSSSSSNATSSSAPTPVAHN